MQIDMLDELLYADDMTKHASTEKMQLAMCRVSQARDKYDLKVSTKKARVVYPPASGNPFRSPVPRRLPEPAITVNGYRLQVVDKFTYLESTLSRSVHIDDDLTARIA